MDSAATASPSRFPVQCTTMRKSEKMEYGLRGYCKSFTLSQCSAQTMRRFDRFFSFCCKVVPEDSSRFEKFLNMILMMTPEKEKN